MLRVLGAGKILVKFSPGTKNFSALNDQGRVYLDFHELS